MAGLVAPKISPLRLGDLEDGNTDELMPGDTEDRRRFAGPTVQGRDLSGITFSECELEGWEVRDAVFTESAFLETRISALFATGFRASRSTFRQVEVDDARIGAVELMDSKLRSVVFTDVRLGFVNLRGAGLTDVIFRGCMLDGIDAGDATLTRVSFEDCTAGEIDVTRAKLQHVDLRGLQVERIRGLEGIAGATMSHLQVLGLAEVFAAHLGIHVTD
ncbi:pentapeptide repeat-containing protein [Tsukamurella tyrosinosolvens]|uniref:pentapeptide repeat-containing protein n=1 Tax=Tsukamurella tyrosinosolvens TaxID=57704 RepID=UPI000DF6B32C|nr:pentapeptide repeat-containing protein [Tsukamurella tyrosinosolvens]MEC4613740.1 pentapeptide repeat-containing protein [Tsukamurella tyrosinosolvens]RDB47859.1 pentapeptide repeat-containing protein [Tsukamurella tyrosinosolvens]